MSIDGSRPKRIPTGLCRARFMPCSIALNILTIDILTFNYFNVFYGILTPYEWFMRVALTSHFTICNITYIYRAHTIDNYEESAKQYYAVPVIGLIFHSILTLVRVILLSDHVDRPNEFDSDRFIAILIFTFLFWICVPVLMYAMYLEIFKVKFNSLYEVYLSFAFLTFFSLSVHCDYVNSLTPGEITLEKGTNYSILCVVYINLYSLHLALIAKTNIDLYAFPLVTTWFLLTLEYTRESAYVFKCTVKSCLDLIHIMFYLHGNSFINNPVKSILIKIAIRTVIMIFLTACYTCVYGVCYTFWSLFFFWHIVFICIDNDFNN